MGEELEVGPLEAVLDQILEANADDDFISVETAVKAVGQRSFGPMLMIPGLMALSPLSGIPGVATTFGVMVFLVTTQLLFGRDHFWLPRFLLRRSVSRARCEKAARSLRKVVRVIDRFIKPRFCFLAEGPAVYVIALVCLLMGLLAPVLELLPFVITALGGVVSLFGLALLARDGLLILIAFCFCVTIAGLVVWAAL